MKILTLSFLVKDSSILLAMKKRGFGEGRWNGYGGKLKDGESPEDGVIREIKEESRLKVSKEDLEFLGEVDFYFPDKEEWNQKVKIYRVQKWQGEPTETEEMKPKWFVFEDIPYGEMWPGDDEWIKYFLQGEKFSGEIHFKGLGQGVLKADIRKI